MEFVFSAVVKSLTGLFFGIRIASLFDCLVVINKGSYMRFRMIWLSILFSIGFQFLAFVLPANAQSAADRACLDRIKLQMSESKFLFQPVDRSKLKFDLEDLNSRIQKAQFENKAYLFSKALESAKANKVGVVQSKLGMRFNSEILAAGPFSEFKFKTEIELIELTSNQNPIRKTEQKFNITKNCDLKMTSLTQDQFNYQDPEKIVVQHLSFYSDSGDQSGLETIPMKSGEQLFIFANMFDLAQLKKVSQKNNYVYAQRNISKGKIRIVSETGNNIVAELSQDAAALFDIELFDIDSKNYRQTVFGNEIKISEVAEWLTIYPEESAYANRHKMNISLQSLEAKRLLKIELLYRFDLFENLNEYWSKTSEIEVSKEKPYKNRVTLTSVIRTKISSIPLSIKTAGSEKYLQDSPLVQKSHPAIQLIAAELLDNFSATRADMVLKILDKLPGLCKYNKGLASNNLNRSLTTSEILAASGGVCTHFANVFVAIARAVGIPSRIVSGLSLGDGGLIAHAWVEFESIEGRWLPIEPQSKSLGFDAALYFPIGVSLLDETDKVDAVIVKMTDFIKLNEIE